MQSPEIILSNELFTVSVILWIGTFALLFWQFIRMQGLDKAIATLASAGGQEVNLPKMLTRIPVYVALILELAGVVVLLTGLFAWIPIPLYPMSIVLWAGVFVMMFWQMISMVSIEKSLSLVTSGANQE